MPSYPHIDRYYEEKQRFIEFGGSDNEQNIRRAFALCLDSYCRERKLQQRTDKRSLNSAMRLW